MRYALRSKRPPNEVTSVAQGPAESAASRLPNEIWDLVFNELQRLSWETDEEEESALFTKAAAAVRLTCRAWEPPARAQLFKYVKTNVFSAKANKKIREIVKNERLRHAVTEVRFIYECPALKCHTSLDAMMIELEGFEEDGTMFDKWEADEERCTKIIPQIMACLPNVTSIVSEQSYKKISPSRPRYGPLKDIEAEYRYMGHGMSELTKGPLSINFCRPREHDPLFLTLKTLFDQTDTFLSKVTSLDLTVEFVNDLEAFGLLPSRTNPSQELKPEMKRLLSNLTNFFFTSADRNMGELQIYGEESRDYSFLPSSDDEAVLVSARYRSYVEVPQTHAVASMISHMKEVSTLNLVCFGGVPISPSINFPPRLAFLSLVGVAFDSSAALLAAMEVCNGTLKGLLLRECSLEKDGEWADVFEYLSRENKYLKLRECRLSTLKVSSPYSLATPWLPSKSDTYLEEANGISNNVRGLAVNKYYGPGLKLVTIMDARLKSAIYRLRDKVIKRADPALFSELRQIESLDHDGWLAVLRKWTDYWHVSDLYIRQVEGK